jgi:hypothetical protein
MAHAKSKLKLQSPEVNLPIRASKAVPMFKHHVMMTYDEMEVKLHTLLNLH